MTASGILEAAKTNPEITSVHSSELINPQGPNEHLKGTDSVQIKKTSTPTKSTWGIAAIDGDDAPAGETSENEQIPPSSENSLKTQASALSPEAEKALDEKNLTAFFLDICPEIKEEYEEKISEFHSKNQKTKIDMTEDMLETLGFILDVSTSIDITTNLYSDLLSMQLVFPKCFQILNDIQLINLHKISLEKLFHKDENNLQDLTTRKSKHDTFQKYKERFIKIKDTFTLLFYLRDQFSKQSALMKNYDRSYLKDLTKKDIDITKKISLLKKLISPQANFFEMTMRYSQNQSNPMVSYICNDLRNLITPIETAFEQENNSKEETFSSEPDKENKSNKSFF